MPKLRVASRSPGDPKTDTPPSAGHCPLARPPLVSVTLRLEGHPGHLGVACKDPRVSLWWVWQTLTCCPISSQGPPGSSNGRFAQDPGSKKALGTWFCIRGHPHGSNSKRRSELGKLRHWPGSDVRQKPHYHGAPNTLIQFWPHRTPEHGPAIPHPWVPSPKITPSAHHPKVCVTSLP